MDLLHLVDHILRGDFHWPIDAQSVGFLVVAVWLQALRRQLAIAEHAPLHDGPHAHGEDVSGSTERRG